jgi:hypothetical protein
VRRYEDDRDFDIRSRELALKIESASLRKIHRGVRRSPLPSAVAERAYQRLLGSLGELDVSADPAR